MKLRLIVALSSALAVAACSNSSSKPAQEPTTPTSDPSTTSATASATYPTGQSSNSSITNGPTSANGGSTATAYDKTTMNGAPGSAHAPATGGNSTSSSIPAAPVDPNVNANGTGVAQPPAKNVDNTKVNERDRHGTLTPMDQGNSKSETQITAAIRKGIVADKALGFDAKNVKVITTGSKVTLRGPVKTEQEDITTEPHFGLKFTEILDRVMVG